MTEEMQNKRQSFKHVLISLTQCTKLDTIHLLSVETMQERFN